MKGFGVSIKELANKDLLSRQADMGEGVRWEAFPPKLGLLSKNAESYAPVFPGLGRQQKTVGVLEQGGHLFA